MTIIRSKSAQNYYKKICSKVVARKTKYFRRNVHINHDDTNLRIIRIKNEQQFDLEIKGYKSLPNDVCYFLYHVYKDVNLNILSEVNNSEFIVTDSKTNKIISFNKLDEIQSEFINIWIVKKNIIDFLKLKIGDLFFTR